MCMYVYLYMCVCMYVCVLIESVPAPFFSPSASTFVSISWNLGGTRRGGGVFARGDGIQHVHVSQARCFGLILFF
jgi:hypothetical protein